MYRKPGKYQSLKTKLKCQRNANAFPNKKLDFEKRQQNATWFFANNTFVKLTLEAPTPQND